MQLSVFASVWPVGCLKEKLQIHQMSQIYNYRSLLAGTGHPVYKPLTLGGGGEWTLELPTPIAAAHKI